MQSNDPRPVLTPLQAHLRYGDDMTLYAPDGERPLVLPGVIGTVFFEHGARPEVRAGILRCFDRFEELFGQELKGGKAADLAKFSRKTAAGLQSIRRAIVETPPSGEVSVARASATDQDTAAAYQIKTLTNTEFEEESVAPGGLFVAPKGFDAGYLSYIKFQVPLRLVTDDEGLKLYETFLRFVCANLPVRGGYGGLSPLLPYSYHRFMPAEYELAKRFIGLEIDSRGFDQSREYMTASHEEDAAGTLKVSYPYLKPGADVTSWGFIKSVNWYTLLGDVFVERLGGEDKLRADLARPDIGIERIGQCMLIRAGAFPRLGAPEEGKPEPYVFVNSVLRVLRNPDPDSLHLHIPALDHANPAETVRWEARFDLPGAPPIPKPPKFVPPPRPPVSPAQPIAYAGQPCPQTGDWQAPRLRNRIERVVRGQPMPGPEFTSSGAVVWFLMR
ncbi:type VI immunity family protein [Pseudacidovorax intermedius]|uniref:type VI immunity family protein n=1 Tax=Pseudacidovorax intermedius TaxID=433924 RepID=UPI00128F6193|nr:type VI immunity family protein [Pseudacidovorax intermedius]